MLRIRFLAPLFALALLGSSLLMGQDRTDSVVGRLALPKPYSQLNLNPKQKNEVARIRQKYTAEIVELEAKLRAVKKEEKKEIEKLLTATQKARLQQIRGGKDDDDEDDLPPSAEKKQSAATKQKK